MSEPITHDEVAEMALRVKASMPAACASNPGLKPAVAFFARHLLERNPETSRTELGSQLMQQGALVAHSVMHIDSALVYGIMSPGMLFVSDVLGVAGALLWFEDEL